MKHSTSLLVIAALFVGCQSKPKQEDTKTTVSTMSDSAASLAKRPGPDAPRSAADRLVRALYFEHQKTDNPFRTTDLSLIEQFFTKPIAAQILSARLVVKKDLLFKAPDASIKKTWVEPAAVGGSRAIVYTTFEQDRKHQEIRLDLKQIAGRWRIDDIIYPDNTRLTQLLK